MLCAAFGSATRMPNEPKPPASSHQLPADTLLRPDRRLELSGSYLFIRAGLLTSFGCWGVDWLGLWGRLLAQKNRQAYERKNRNELALPVLERFEPEPRGVHIAPGRS